MRAETDGAAAGRRGGGLGHVLANAGWLLGGKAVGGILSVIYLGLATRTLGVAGFGQFALVLGAGQGVAALVGFQTWQIIVRYGSVHLHSCDRARLVQLQRFCALLDAASALVGAALAWIGITLLGPRFGWTEDFAREAFLFCLVLLVAVRSTPTGILRLHDRFAVSAGAEAITPVVRVIGAGIAALVGGGASGFLLAWAAAEVATAVGHWLLAAQSGPLFRGGALAGVTRANPGLWRYAAVTNAAGSLNLVARQVAVLIIGLLVSPAAAGSYRLAFQLGQALTKLSAALSRAIMPELMRRRVAASASDFRALLSGASRFSAAAAALVVLLLLVAGREIIALVAGPAFVGAYPLLVILGAAAALDLAGVALEPALYAADRAGTALAIRASSAALLLALLLLLADRFGAIGAAAATLFAGFFSLILFVLTVRRQLVR